MSLMHAEETLHWIDRCTQKARIRGGCVDSAITAWGHRAGEARLLWFSWGCLGLPTLLSALCPALISFMLYREY